MKYKPARTAAIFFGLFFAGQGGGEGMAPLPPPLDPPLNMASESVRVASLY